MWAFRASIAVACCLMVLVSPLGAASLPGGTPIKEEAAIAAYAQAAKALGIAQVAERPAVSGVEKRTSEWATAVGSVRKVHLSQLSVDVDVYSGKIVRVVNESAWKKCCARAEMAQELGKGLMPGRSPKQVADAAENYCRALGQSLSPDVKFRAIEFDDKRGCWNLGLFRYINGYLFDEESIGMAIDDQTGVLVTYGNGITEITCDTDVRVPKDKALNIARGWASQALPNLAGKEPYNILEDEEPRLWIVYVTKILTDKKAEAVPPSGRLLRLSARLVYDFPFKFSYIGKENVHRSLPPASVWVDAATGEVVGGDVSGLR